MKNKKDDFIQMSWIMLEYEVFYYLETSHLLNAHTDWKTLRKISDEDYDAKEVAFKKYAISLGEKAERPVGIDPERASVKIIIEKFHNAMFSTGVEPLIWPHPETETDYELTVRAQKLVFGTINNPKFQVVKKKNSKKKAI